MNARSPKAEIVTVDRIWDRAPQNAFTDLIRFEDAWYCVFREGRSHVSPDGCLRVITSPDGQSWSSAAFISHPDGDLRDAKITATPDGRLMLSGAVALRQPAPVRHRSLAWFSENGRAWSPPTQVGDDDMWVWRITWHEDVAYGVGYATGEDAERFVRLYRSEDGQHFNTLVDNLFDQGYPNETSLLFLPDETCLCLLRRDPDTAQLGKAAPPYTDWSWQDLGLRLGGPHMTRLPDGRIVAAGRLYGDETRTALLQLDLQEGTLTPLLILPSGGDTSYPGLIYYKGRLWISYYSSHESKTAIYLAQVRV